MILKNRVGTATLQLCLINLPRNIVYTQLSLYFFGRKGWLTQLFFAKISKCSNTLIFINAVYVIENKISSF